MQTLIANVLARKDAGAIAMDEPHGVGLSLGVSYFKQLTAVYADPNVAFENNGTQLYSTTTHKYYNQLQSMDLSGYGILAQANWMSDNFAFLNFLPQDIFGFSEANIKAMPTISNLDASKLAAMLSYEQQAVGKYFWPRLFVDPRNSQLYTFNGTDPDGYARPDGVELVNFDHAGITMTWDWLNQMASPLASLRLDAPNGGFPCAISLNGCPGDGIFGLADLINLNATPSVATQTVQDITKIWDTKILPSYTKLGQIAAVRRAESEDDFYPGVWRVKMRQVQKVTHDADGKAVSATVVTADGKSLTVPLNGATSSNKDVKKAIADIAEMDKWYNDNLAIAQNLNTGDSFNLLSRTDLSKGICGANQNTGTVPYNTVEEILDNYSSTPKIVNVDIPLADLVYQNGFAVSRLLYDIREYLANQYVKENFAHYNFADAASAGLCKTNQANQLVTYDMVYEDLSALNTNTFGTSDIGVLGRHYGYDVNGNIKADEWSNGKLIYKYQPFDYIYRQHYAVDNSVPLTPDNFSDPKSSGRKFYQYSDTGDETKRSAFIAAFLALETTTKAQAEAGKPGSYLRWKIDWTLQKLAAYVIASIAGNTPNVAAQNLLPHDFQQSYYASTFEDTNDNNTDFCGFGLNHTAQEKVHFRAVGQLAGSANSGTSLDRPNKIVTIKIAFPTFDPINVQTTQSIKSTLLHEGALGHGFDNIPKNIDQLRGATSILSWLTNFNQNGDIPTEGF